MYDKKTIKKLERQWIRFRYEAESKEAHDPVEFRKGKDPDQVEGRLEQVKVSNDGSILLMMRNIHRITPEESKRYEKGEYQYRSHRADRIKKGTLEACLGGKWKKV